MEAALAPLLDGDKARQARWENWKYDLEHATWREQISRRGFYQLRILALVSAITVPSLVGLNLAGTGGTVVRWLTFALSLVAAIATGILTLYRVTDRWLMYRKLMADLMRIGCTLVDAMDPQVLAADPTADWQAWEAFGRASDLAVRTYNKTYETTVIQVAQAGASAAPGPGAAGDDAAPSRARRARAGVVGGGPPAEAEQAVPGH